MERPQRPQASDVYIEMLNIAPEVKLAHTVQGARDEAQAEGVGMGQ